MIIFDQVYDWLAEVLEDIANIGYILIAMLCMILTIITIPVWIIPYLIYRRKKE